MKTNFLIIVLCLFVVSAFAQNDAVVSTFHATQTHDGVYTGADYKGFGEVKWRFATEGKVFASPAVYQGVTYIGSADGNLYAIDNKSGALRWKFTTGGAVHSTAVVTTGAVYFGSFDGHYYAVDRVTGKEKWRFKTGGEQWMGAKGYWGMKPSDQYMEDLWDFYLSSPIADTTPEGTTLYFGSSDGTVYALNADTGTERWKFKTSGSIHSSPALYGGVVYIGSWDAHLYALDAKSGTLKWKFRTGGDVGMTGILSSPTIHNGLVYFGARDAKFYALSAETGELRWTYDANGSWIMSTATVRGDYVYTTTSDSFLFIALDAVTGAEQFRFKANGYVFSSPALVGNTAFFGDFTGKMFALDLSSKGVHSSEFVTPARKEYSKSFLKNDFLDFGYLAAGGDFSFYKTSSDVMKKLYKLGPIVSSPVVDEGVIYFGSADGYVYAVKLQTDRAGSAQ